MRSADRRVSTYTASPGTSPYVGKSAVFSRPRKSSRSGDGVDDCAGEEVRPCLLALLEDGDRDVAEPLADLGVLLQELSETDRAREAAGPRADDGDADVDPLVRRIARHADRVDRAEGRVKSIGLATSLSRASARAP